MRDEKIQEFMRELENLSRRTGMAVHGCGCCSSPFLIEVSVDSEFGYVYTFAGAGEASDICWVKKSDDPVRG